MVSIAGVINDAEGAVRELAVYLSHDLDAARRRGDPEAARILRSQWERAGRLADELHQLRPEAVATEPRALAEVRALATDLSLRLAAMTPARRGTPRSRRDVATIGDVRATPGQPPYGYMAVAGELVPDLDEQRQVQRMVQLRNAGHSLREIADALNDDGVPARRGQWHPQTVARVVDRATTAHKAS